MTKLIVAFRSFANASKTVIIYLTTPGKCGPGSSVGITTDLQAGRPGIESRWDEIFRLSRPTLGPTPPPVKWLPGLSRG